MVVISGINGALRWCEGMAGGKRVVVMMTMTIVIVMMMMMMMIDVRVRGRIPVGQPLSLDEPRGHRPGIVAETVETGHRSHAALRAAAPASPPPL